jgi:hypothetical protein
MSSGKGISLDDHEFIWHYIEEELAELAMEIGPPAPLQLLLLHHQL